MNDRIARLLEDLPAPDEGARRAVAERAASVLRPADALARLDGIAAWLAGWQRTERPGVEAPAAVVFVADHGVAHEGVSAYPAAVTAAMLDALQAGAATAAALARTLGATLDVVDVGVGRPTGNIAREPALDDERFHECFEAGRDSVKTVDTDLLVLGEMGIANTTPAAAICAALFAGPVDDWVGRGTGIDDAALKQKIAVVSRARARIESITDPLETLREVGGAELVAIAGAILEARRRSIPVLLDGYVVCASAAPLEVARPGALDHCISGHRSAEKGHRLLLERLDKQPLLDLEMRLGEASGALAALPLVRLAAAAVTDVATFEEWGLG